MALSVPERHERAVSRALAATSVAAYRWITTVDGKKILQHLACYQLPIDWYKICSIKSIYNYYIITTNGRVQ